MAAAAPTPTPTAATLLLIEQRVRHLAAEARKTEQTQTARASNAAIRSALRAPAMSHARTIEHQVNGGIGGHRHQHGIPGGRYSAHGACSARARHRKRSKK